MVDNGEGRAPRQRPGPAPTITATNGPAIVPEQGGPRPVGELLAAWVGAELEEVDDLMAEARSSVEAIDRQRQARERVGMIDRRCRLARMAGAAMPMAVWYRQPKGAFYCTVVEGWRAS